MTADVVVPVYGALALTRACLEAVLRESGPALGTLWLVNDCSPVKGMERLLVHLRDRHEQVRLLHTHHNSGFVIAANLGLLASTRDVVVLNSDTLVTAGWLSALLATFEAFESLVALSPLSDNAGACSIVGLPRGTEPFGLQALPAFTEMPTAHGFCLALRRVALRQMGAFDPAYGRGYNEENDWCQRARARGYRVGRCNHSFVRHVGEASFQGARHRLDEVNARRLLARYPRYYQDVRAFDRSPAARVRWTGANLELGPAPLPFDFL